MTTTVQIIDAATNAILFDCNDPQGANNPRGIRTSFGIGGAFNLGAPDQNITEFTPDSAPGGLITKVLSKLTTSSWRQRIVADDYETLSWGANELQRLLSRGGVIAYSLEGDSTVKYIDFEPWHAPALQRGEQYQSFNLAQLTQDVGMPIEIYRQPFTRGLRLYSDDNLLANGSLLRSYTTPSRPEFWAWSSTSFISSEAIDPEREGYLWVVGASGQTYLRQTIAASPGDIHTFSVYMTDILDAVGPAVTSVILEYLDVSLTVLQSNRMDFTGTPTETRYSVSSAPAGGAPSQTIWVRVGIGTNNATTDQCELLAKRAQLEFGSSATDWREGTAAITNDPDEPQGQVLIIDNQGSAATPCNLKIQGEASEDLISSALGSRGSQRIPGAAGLVELLNGNNILRMQDCTVIAGSGATISGTDVQSNGRLVMKVTPSDDQMRKRVTGQIIGDPALRGEFVVLMRAYIGGATDDIRHNVKLYYSPSLAPAGFVPLDEVPLYCNSHIPEDFSWANMGTISIPEAPENIDGITFDLWSDGNLNAGELRVDYLILIPAEFFGKMKILPLGKRVWLGSDLQGGATVGFPNVPDAAPANGAVVGTTYQFTANHDSCGTNPVSGDDYTDGLHRVSFDVLQGPTDAGVCDLIIWQKTGSTWQVYGGIGYFINESRTVRPVYFKALPGKLYTLGGITPSGSAPSDPFIIYRIIDEFLPLPASDGFLTSDFERFAIRVSDDSDSLIAYGGLEGRFPVWLEPGLNVIPLVFGQYPTTDYGKDRAQIRTHVVSYSYAPRWFE